VGYYATKFGSQPRGATNSRPWKLERGITVRQKELIKRGGFFGNKFFENQMLYFQKFKIIVSLE
jgi:hypothetical protein